MTAEDQGWMIDDGPDEDDIWDDDPYDGFEPDNEPDCWGCWTSSSGTCWPCGGRPPLKQRRRNARHVGHWLRRLRKRVRHANDHPWRARNQPPADEAPF